MLNVMPDLFRHPKFIAQISGSRSVVCDDKAFLRMLLVTGLGF